MKTSTLFALLAIVITCGANAQTSGGGASGSAGAAAASGTPATMPAAPAPPPGLINRNQLPPGLQNRPLPPGLSNRFAARSNFLATNQFGINSNLQSTNQFGMTTNEEAESNGFSPTGAASGTNQLNSNLVFQDEAETPADQSLLVTLRQKVQVQLGITRPAAMPVHFVIDDGVVTLVGFVPTADESQRVLLLAQQTAGVVQVIDRLQIGSPPPGALQPFLSAGANLGRITDHAFSPTDQALLARIRQEAAVQLGVSKARRPVEMTVHFSIQNGAVTVMGQVFSNAQKQALLARIQSTPGVVNVVDDLGVVAQNSGVPATSPNPPTVNSNLSPTSTGQSNMVFRNSTNGSQ